MTEIPRFYEKMNKWNDCLDYMYVGLRFQDEPMKVGEVIDHKSHVWDLDTEEDTGVELSGLCVLSQERIDKARYYFWMKHCAIVGYDDMEYDQEYGDHIAKNPIVLEVLK